MEPDGKKFEGLFRNPETIKRFNEFLKKKKGLELTDKESGSSIPSSGQICNGTDPIILVDLTISEPERVVANGLTQSTNGSVSRFNKVDEVKSIRVPADPSTSSAKSLGSTVKGKNEIDTGVQTKIAGNIKCDTVNQNQSLTRHRESQKNGVCDVDRGAAISSDVKGGFTDSKKSSRLSNGDEKIEQQILSDVSKHNHLTKMSSNKNAPPKDAKLESCEFVRKVKFENWLSNSEKLNRFKAFLLKNKGLYLQSDNQIFTGTSCRSESKVSDRNCMAPQQSRFYTLDKDSEAALDSDLKSADIAQMEIKVEMDSDIEVDSDFEYEDGLSDIKIVNDDGVIKIEFESDEDSDDATQQDTSNELFNRNNDLQSKRPKTKTKNRSDEILQCHHCPRVFATRESAKQHMEKDHAIQFDECIGCDGKKFVNIATHHQQYHIGNKTCPVCGKSFRYTFMANRHMLLKHREYLALQNQKVNKHVSAPPKPLNVKEEYEKLFEETEVKPRTDLLDRKDFLISYDEALAGPDWTVEALDSSNAVKEKPEIFPPFIKDPELVSIQFSPRAMKMYPQYDTGHLAAAGNYYGKPEAFTNSFRMSNCRPMKKGFHRGVWTSLECFIREKLLLFWDKIIVYTGAIYDEKSKMKEAPGCVPLKIASYFYKALCLFREGEDEPQTLAFLIPHKNLYSGFCQFVCPVEKIESSVGFKFFPKYHDRSAWDLAKSSFSANWDIVIEKNYLCERCGKAFSSKVQLTHHHTIIHLKLKPYICEKCGTCFNTKSALTFHIKRIHMDKKQYMCHKCGKSFRIWGNLKSHDRIVHIKIKSYVCDKCGRGFCIKGQLDKHDKIVHQKIKRYACHKCKRSFNRKDALEIHDRGVHQKLKPFMCGKCGSTFTLKNSLEVHDKNVHQKIKPFKCGKCGKIFAKKKNLETHDQCVHQKLKPFKCDKCGMTFTAKKSLKNHDKVVHLKLKPHVCDKCGKAFSRKYTLNKHHLRHLD